MIVETPNYNVNYDDERFADIAKGKQDSLDVVNATYGSMISNADKYYQSQIEASQEWADKQSQLQQEQTDFTVNQINQQKEQAQKDYQKEQSGAYVDWQKQSNAYGANAEALAAQGLAGSGYSESSRVSMYNTYQNRVATARESYNKAVLNYDNSIKEAQLQNSVALAEIAYNTLQKQLELSLSGFQYQNTLLQAQLTAQQSVENTYYQRYLDVLDQINRENSLAEQVRQYNTKLNFEEEQAKLDREHDFAVLAEKAKYDEQYANLFEIPGADETETETEVEEKPVATFTPQDAIEILNEQGAGRFVSNMKSEKQWQASRAAMPYATYEEYLRAYVNESLTALNTPKKTYDIVEQEKETDPFTDKSMTSFAEMKANYYTDTGKTMPVTYKENGKKKTVEVKLLRGKDGKLWIVDPETGKYRRVGE